MSPQAFGFFSCFFSFSFFLYMQIIIISPSQSVKKAFASITSKTQSPRSVSSGKNSSHALTPVLSIVPGWANSRNVQFSVILRWCWLIFIPNNQINVLVETRLEPLNHTLSPSAPPPAAVTVSCCSRDVFVSLPLRLRMACYVHPYLQVGQKDRSGAALLLSAHM